MFGVCLQCQHQHLLYWKLLRTSKCSTVNSLNCYILPTHLFEYIRFAMLIWRGAIWLDQICSWAHCLWQSMFHTAWRLLSCSNNGSGSLFISEVPHRMWPCCPSPFFLKDFDCEYQWGVQEKDPLRNVNWSNVFLLTCTFHICNIHYVISVHSVAEGFVHSFFFKYCVF